MLGSALPSGSRTTSCSADIRRTQSEGSHPVTEINTRLRAEVLMTFPTRESLLTDHAFRRGCDVERGGNQRLGIVGLRILENLFDRSMFDDLAIAHDNDVV